MEGREVSNPTVVGVDPSSKKIAIYTSWGTGHQTVTFRGHKGTTRHEVNFHFYESCRLYFRDLPRPFHLFIEQPVVGVGGPRSTIVQAQSGAAVTLAAVRTGAASITEVNNKTWKKAVVGNGNSSKDAVKAWLEAKHPDKYALCPDDQDLVDAVCIGLFGVHSLS